MDLIDIFFKIISIMYLQIDKELWERGIESWFISIRVMDIIS
jgi:hypothetical protein